MKKFTNYLLSLALSIGTFACVHEAEQITANQNAVDITSVQFPKGFTFNAHKKVMVGLSARTAQKEAIKSVPLSFYDDQHNLLFSGMTNQAGIFNEEIELPQGVQKLYVETAYAGLHDSYSAEVVGNRCTFEIGNDQAISASPAYRTKSTSLYKYMGAYNSLGVPNYLEANRDKVGADFLEDIVNTLPESRPVPKFNPQYIVDEVSTTINVKKEADIWVTFVHERADYKNALGYYTFDPANPPKTVADIKNLTIIYPNTSYVNSGGGLVAGDKVKLGRFPAGTTIGWFLVANGWDSNKQEVGNGYYKHFSNTSLNNEANADLRRHNVLIKDDKRKLILLGFEDIRRDYSFCDQDFNDAVYYVTAEPYSAIYDEDLPDIKEEADCDNDGIPDAADAYPCDATKASKHPVSGTLAYEDLYPAQGDFDFNDMVIDYTLTQIRNAKNEVVEMEGKFVLKAIGAAFANGFAIEMPIAPSLVKSVSGNMISESFLSFNSNGTEAAQSKAVIVVWDNASKLMPRTSKFFINTEMEAPKIPYYTVNMKVAFTTPLSVETLGAVPYNPFIFVNRERGKEVHLAGKTPTDLVNTTYFGKSADRTNPATGTYYQAANGLPFALHLPLGFSNYPLERAAINLGYTKFIEWGVSGGKINTNWYTNEAGNRNWNFIYKK